MFYCGHHKLALALTRATVMTQSIQALVQVAVLVCVVSTSIGGITDFEEKISQLENKVKVSQEELKSLHQMFKLLEKRLEPLEVKGEFEEIQNKTNTTCISNSSCPLVRHILLLTTTRVNACCHSMLQVVKCTLLK